MFLSAGKALERRKLFLRWLGNRRRGREHIFANDELRLLPLAAVLRDLPEEARGINISFHRLNFVGWARIWINAQINIRTVFSPHWLAYVKLRTTFY
jgi:hypothetical protein